MISNPSQPPEEIKLGHAKNFNDLNEQLSRSSFDDHVRFFNFGYVPLGDEIPNGPRLGPYFPNKESAQLLFEVVGDVSLEQGEVAEVGCGRGGNLWLINRYYRPRHTYGLDIAHLSTRFANSHYRSDPISLVTGDAESLPWSTASIDALINIETSCTYPSIDRFYREVARVVKRHGWFLYADLFSSDMLPAMVVALCRLGFEVRDQRDITNNVIESRRQRADRQRLAFGETDDKPSWDEFVGLGGTRLNDYLSSGERSYQILRLQLSGRSDDSEEPLFSPEMEARLRVAAAEGVEILSTEERRDL